MAEEGADEIGAARGLSEGEKGCEINDDENVDDDEVIEEEVEEDEVQDEGSEEVDEVPNKCFPNPRTPTQAMLDAHNVSHTPYVNWCASCVRARGRKFPHKRIKSRQDSVPVMSGDYLIAEGKTATVVIIDRDTHVIFAHIVPHKGIRFHWYTEAVMKKDIESMGYKKLVLKCDQETALKSGMRAVQNWCSCEVLLENSPVGDKGANGEA